MNIDQNAVSQIYIGQDNACRCGCKGEYSRPEDGVIFSKRLKRFMNMVNKLDTNVEVEDTYVNVSYGKDRAMTVYFK